MEAPETAIADTSSRPSISITPLTPASQPSGTAFQYRVSYTCSNVNASPCAANPTVTIPLGAAANPTWAVIVGANPLITSWARTGDNLVISLADLTEGVAGAIGITITPPNRTTPNGTSWTLTPTMTFTDGTPTVTTGGTTSTATADGSIRVEKRSDQAFYRPGDTVEYYLRWICPYYSSANTGKENLSALRLVDTLPPGLTYVSSNLTGATVSGQTVTFDLTDAAGNLCIANDTVNPITIRAKVGTAVPDGARPENKVTAKATTISGAVHTDSKSAVITVTSTVPGATVAKRGGGPLLSRRDLGGAYSATYPGAWLQRGVAQSTSSTLRKIGDVEAQYSLDVVMPSAGLQSSIVDPMPCATNVTGSRYSSNDPGTTCQEPAFHPTMVTVRAGKSENAQNVGIPAAFVPQARLIDGSMISLTAGPIVEAETLANGPEYRSYFVPATALERVAEIVIPRAAGMTNTHMNVVIGGYADADRVKGDVLQNSATTNSYQPGDTAPYSTTTSTGRVFIVEGPQIGLSHQWLADASAFALQSNTLFSGPTTGDLIFINTYPEGVSFAGPATMNVSRAQGGSATNIPITVTTSADPATGRTTVKTVVSATTINELLPANGGDELRWALNLPSKTDFPGNYTNTASISLSDPLVNNDICGGDATKAAGTTGAGHECLSTYRFTVNPRVDSDAVRVTKSVRGSLDTAFKGFPAIGYVASGGGDATFRLTWTNKSQQKVGDLVMYDLLPRIGDTGTVTGTTDQQRGSTFRPILTGFSTLPAGVTAFYSTSTNPCRPEVLPNAQNAGCVDDWVALPASPSAALLQSVRALRFASTATYAFDQGLVIDLTMTTPPLSSVGDVAWNTVATAQTNLASGQSIPPVESAKVGIAREDFSHITIGKVVDKTVANVGDLLTYTVSAVNDGGRDLSDVTLRDTLPAGVTFVSASGGGVPARGEVTWNLANMPLGQQFAYTVMVRVAREGAALVNRFGVDGRTPVTPLHPCAEPNDDDESCATTTVPAVALTYAKTSDPAPGTMVKTGDTVTYSVTVSNATGSLSTSGIATDDMSELLDKATLTSPPVLTCAPVGASCGQVAYTAGDSELVWRSTAGAPLAAHTTAKITYTVKLDDDASGTLRNLLVEPGIAVEHPILSVDKTVDKGAGSLVYPGDDVKYTLSITNSGAVDSGPFSVFDDLSDVVGNATLDEASIAVDPAVGTAAYDADTHHLAWTGALAAGQTVQVSYTVAVNDDAFGELRNVFLDKTVVNPISGTLQWTKIDESPQQRLLAGSEWTLQVIDEDGRPTGVVLTVEDCIELPCSGPEKDPAGGALRVPNLTPGDYQLVETKAPAGYVLDTTVRTVTVLGTVQATVLDGIVNQQQGVPVLPFTGADGQLALMIAGAALAVIAVGGVLFSRRRKAAEEA